jgi:hypothetical protein
MEIADYYALSNSFALLRQACVKNNFKKGVNTNILKKFFNFLLTGLYCGYKIKNKA